jgi:hypothetical protein
MPFFLPDPQNALLPLLELEKPSQELQFVLAGPLTLLEFFLLLQA